MNSPKIDSLSFSLSLSLSLTLNFMKLYSHSHKMFKALYMFKMLLIVVQVSYERVCSSSHQGSVMHISSQIPDFSSDGLRFDL